MSEFKVIPPEDKMAKDAVCCMYPGAVCPGIPGALHPEFRGKRADNGDWIKGDYNYSIIEEAPAIRHYVNVGWGTKEQFVAVIPETVGQCAGLTAAKSYRGTRPENRLVFEGDICEDEQGGPFVIEFINTPQFYGLAMKYLTDGELMHLEEFSPITDRIIGNIHANPELLERSKTDERY